MRCRDYEHEYDNGHANQSDHADYSDDSYGFDTDVYYNDNYRVDDHCDAYDGDDIDVADEYVDHDD